MDTDVIPGQDFVFGAQAMDEPVEVNAGLATGLFPDFRLMPFVPGVKFRAQFPGAFDRSPDAPIAQ